VVNGLLQCKNVGNETLSDKPTSLIVERLIADNHPFYPLSINKCLSHELVPGLDQKKGSVIALDHESRRAIICFIIVDKQIQSTI
jgi:hypothetical protein